MLATTPTNLPPSRAGQVLTTFFLAAVGGIGADVAYRYFTGPAPAHAVAKAVISNVGNSDNSLTPVPPSYPNGKIIVLSAAGSTVSAGNNSLKWEVEPPSLAATMLSIPGADASHLVLVMPATGRVDARVRLYVTRKDTIDVATASFVGGSGGLSPDPAPPGPAPDPFPPGPSPDPLPPLPTPSGPIDPAIRKAAADYFGSTADGYAGIPPQIAATDANYNDVMASLVAKHVALNKTLSDAVVAILSPTYDPATLKFLDKKVAQTAYAKVANSLKAGMRDAASR